MDEVLIYVQNYSVRLCS